MPQVLITDPQASTAILRNALGTSMLKVLIAVTAFGQYLFEFPSHPQKGKKRTPQEHRSRKF